MQSMTLSLTGPREQSLCDEFDILLPLLPWDGAEVLELGCGTAQKTRVIAERTGVARIVAAEVDPVAHRRNLAISDLPRVRFASFGAEAIDAPEASFDIVLMFKSLHHVPVERMDDALVEIRRVLKPGGWLYVSEPVFDGALNEVMRVFHDEEQVRLAAWQALQRAVSRGLLQHERQIFFRSPQFIGSFEDYQRGIEATTHTDHTITEAQLAEMRRRFERNGTPAEGYRFEVPNRVDLLRRARS